MKNPFKRGTLYAFYFQQLTRKRVLDNIELLELAHEKFPNASYGGLRLFRSQLRAGNFTRTPLDIPRSNG